MKCPYNVRYKTDFNFHTFYYHFQNLLPHMLYSRMPKGCLKQLGNLFGLYENALIICKLILVSVA